ncbi:MAG: hypothetical protein ACRCYT_04810 [Cetobacterium sp.]
MKLTLTRAIDDFYWIEKGNNFMMLPLCEKLLKSMEQEGKKVYNDKRYGDFIYEVHKSEKNFVLTRTPVDMFEVSSTVTLSAKDFKEIKAFILSNKN